MRQIPAPGRNGDEMPSLLRQVIDLLLDIGTIAGTGDDFVLRG